MCFQYNEQAEFSATLRGQAIHGEGAKETEKTGYQCCFKSSLQVTPKLNAKSADDRNLVLLDGSGDPGTGFSASACVWS